MLVLSRKLNEEIVIGEAGEVRVRVLSIEGNKVRLGITAPTNVPVHRSEVYKQIQLQQQGDGDARTDRA